MAVTHALLGASALFAEHYCPPRSTYWGRSHIYSISSNWLAELAELQKVIFLAQPAPKNTEKEKMQQPLACSTPPPIVIIIIIVIVIIVIIIIIIIMIKRE